MSKGSQPIAETLIISKTNNYGLTRDAEILGAAIRKAGGEVAVADISGRGVLERLTGKKRARRIIHLERAHPRWFGAASHEQLLIPNQERFPMRQLKRLAGIDRVLAKSHHAEAIFSGLGAPTEYFGFSSEDRFDAAVARDWNAFFHLAGGSTLKGTDAVLDLWRRHPEWPQLVIVQKAANAPQSVPANVRLLSGYLDDGELRRLQNACGVHLCPSLSEGWGHHIVEAMSCGVVVVTTDAPPMNEHIDAGCGIPVASDRSQARHLGTSFFVDTRAFEQAIEGLIDMAAAQRAAMGNRARMRYEAIADGFQRRVAALVGDR